MSEPRFIIQDDRGRIVSVPESMVKWKSQIIRPDAPIGAEKHVSRRPDPPDETLTSMSRDDLNKHAADLGVENPEGFPNKSALIEAIENAGTNPQGPDNNEKTD